MSEKQVQYAIKMYNKENQKSFDHKFYIKDISDYIAVLEQFIDILKGYNLEIDAKTLDVIIVGNRNPKEQRIILERVT